MHIPDKPSENISYNTSQQQRFIADAMLGRLAKWLRIIGHDVIYEPFISDDELIARALRENRIILSMDKKLLERKSAYNSLCIHSFDYKKQLQQVILHYNIDTKKHVFTRCLQCNTILCPVKKEGIKDRVPSYVFSTHDTFEICKLCHRIYWPGTHRESMRQTLNKLFH
ncbi:MAG: hypothetical protein E3K37_07865 [Candidatus Kuenenia sp.]|nr:hypothetical protein [Candidatus Kuenenia hertensis]